MTKHRTYTTTCRVCPQYGTIDPCFSIGGDLTSGTLKYFHALKGKKVRITVEVLEESEDNTKSPGAPQ